MLILVSEYISCNFIVTLKNNIYICFQDLNKTGAIKMKLHIIDKLGIF